MLQGRRRATTDPIVCDACRGRDDGDLRGLSLTEEDAGEGELQRGRHHLLGQGLELELDVRLRGHWTGVLLHVDAAGGQSLSPARRRLLETEAGSTYWVH